jgi:hypothetical protein
VHVWDKTKNSVDQEATGRIPQALRVGGATGQMTVFIIQRRSHTQVGRYEISGQPAYREDLEVTIKYWPQGNCIGNVSLQADPPRRRPVVYVPGYGSVILAEHIGRLRREK